MLAPTYKKILLVLTLAGVLFSGYLSAVKFITSTCALNEPCPYFLGYPACWYGFGMFLILFFASLFSFFNIISLRKTAITSAAVSTVGILFAGYLTVPELGRLLSGTSAYTLGLPSCAYGLIFYILIFGLSIKFIKKQ